MFQALWPGVEVPATPAELAERLLNGHARLCEWHYSAGRVGADEVLSFLLSWYEGIDFDLLQSYRIESKFVSEEPWIQRRKDLAYSFIQFAPVHDFTPGPPIQPPAAEESEEEVTDDEAEEAEKDAEDEAAKAFSGNETPAPNLADGAGTEAPRV